MDKLVKYRTSRIVKHSKDFAQTENLWSFKTRQGEFLNFDTTDKSPEQLKQWQTNCLECATNSKIHILTNQNQ